MARRPPTARRRFSVVLDRASVAVFALLVLLALVTFTDYGTSWDEHVHVEYGDDILAYFRSGMAEAAVPDHHQSYGGGYDLATSLFSSFVSHPRHEANHLFTALLGLLGFVGTWRLGRLLGGSVGGLLALFLLATLPAFYGQMFNNPKDIPFAVGYVWSLFYLCKLLEAGPRSQLRLSVLLGLTMGLAMSVRVGGLLLIGYLGLVVAWQLLASYRDEPGWPALREALRVLTPRTLLSVGLAWAIMILPWPAAHRAPLTHPIEAVRGFTKYGFDTRTLFRGVYVPSNPPPWDYLPGYLGVQLPEVLMLLLVTGLVIALIRLLRGRGEGSWTWRARGIGLLLFAIVFPPTFAIARGSTLYDGVRHFLFILPPLCVLGAVAGAEAAKYLGERSRSAAAAAVAGIGIGIALVVVDMVRLHPYQYVYFNRLSGGLPAAAALYETDYYAHSFKELSEKLADHLWLTERESYLDSDYDVLGCGIMDYLMVDHLPANFRVAREPVLLRRPHGYDFYAGYRRLGCHERRTHLPEVVAVEREGVLLNVIRDMRDDQEIPEAHDQAP